jgi:hypothetical protein
LINLKILYGLILLSIQGIIGKINPIRNPSQHTLPYGEEGPKNLEVPMAPTYN